MRSPGIKPDRVHKGSHLRFQSGPIANSTKPADAVAGTSIRYQMA